MSDNETNERRKHFRVRLEARVAIGPFRTQPEDDPGFALRLKHADAVDRLLVVRAEAEPVLVDAVDAGIDYMVALLDLVVADHDERFYENRELSLSFDEREISLSEGGFGMVGEPPCEVGAELPVVLIITDHPSRRPLLSVIRLVRLQETDEVTYLGFEFVGLDRGMHKHLVDLVFRVQRRQIREARET